ncbi:polyhydroxybutyrate depolymerase [Promicromonospora sp. AC04]|uniref:poly(3-hydroxybutyrate) depolymerase n=1 Tax=Promicromonospora sp. AC04 TaxID=2135723 RepID=UPI000D432A39|nr:poly(3-hydroxybutyrate) depolymerase [Promicromonospora sp. AC04]PUB25515.1 polyhydroxybutyrate depolymerase [Promicromonospora sp. AC04]
MSTTTASPPHRTSTRDARRRPGRRAALLTALALAVSGLAGPIGAASASAVPALPDAAASPSGSAIQAAAHGFARSEGCGTDPGQAPGSSVLRTLTSDGRERTVQLHLPDGYRSDRAWPVVLVFHGRGNTGAGTEAFSGLDALPAIVAYGNGVIGTGDGDRQAWEGAPYSAPGVDDVAYTNDLLDTLESDLCVDTLRVYATGKSNGAGFTGILACELSDRIAAIAPVAAALYGTGHPDCAPERPVPVIDFHGTEDATIPYGGDAERGLPAIQDWVGGWVERNGCATGPDVEETAADVTTFRWTDCAAGAEVTHVAVLGGGHTWPGEDSYSGGGYATHSIEAHEVMWDFLRDERLPARFLCGDAGHAGHAGNGVAS